MSLCSRINSAHNIFGLVGYLQQSRSLFRLLGLVLIQLFLQTLNTRHVQVFEILEDERCFGVPSLCGISELQEDIFIRFALLVELVRLALRILKSFGEAVEVAGDVAQVGNLRILLKRTQGALYLLIESLTEDLV